MDQARANVSAGSEILRAGEGLLGWARGVGCPTTAIHRTCSACPLGRVSRSKRVMWHQREGGEVVEVEEDRQWTRSGDVVEVEEE